ncbi:MAG: DUF2306 domain-containing protein [Chitinophagales bacterium]|nr:DUF2306 domain-containing protein [Chitinophagales bacterium]
MTDLLKPVLIMHIVAGTAALFSGSISIVAEKGLIVHRTSGKVYFWSMLIVACTAAIMSLAKDLDFFLMLSMFACYAAYAGYRSIRNKRRRASILDWLMLCAALITCASMLLSGNLVLTIFGAIFAMLSVNDARDFLKREPLTVRSKRWLVVHIARMMTAYIATTTAFVVVNVSDAMPQQLNALIWLAPTIVFTPLIFFFIRKYTGSKQALLTAAINE